MTKAGLFGPPIRADGARAPVEPSYQLAVRPGAQVEFVIDLQVAACDGCRFFITKAGAIQLPDWMSNRAAPSSTLIRSASAGNCVGRQGI